MTENGTGEWLKKFTVADLIKAGPWILVLATLISIGRSLISDVKIIKREGATRRQVNNLIVQVNKNNYIAENRLETIERHMKIVSKQKMRPVVVYMYQKQEQDDTDVEPEPEWEWEK